MLSDVNAFVRSCLVQSFAIERDFAAGVNEQLFKELYYYTLSWNIGITSKQCKLFFFLVLNRSGNLISTVEAKVLS